MPDTMERPDPNQEAVEEFRKALAAFNAATEEYKVLQEAYANTLRKMKNEPGTDQEMVWQQKADAEKAWADRAACQLRLNAAEARVRELAVGRATHIPVEHRSESVSIPVNTEERPSPEEEEAQPPDENRMRFTRYLIEHGHLTEQAPETPAIAEPAIATDADGLEPYEVDHPQGWELRVAIRFAHAAQGKADWNQASHEVMRLRVKIRHDLRMPVDTSRVKSLPTPIDTDRLLAYRNAVQNGFYNEALDLQSTGDFNKDGRTSGY